jgi:hypothetical protein
MPISFVPYQKEYAEQIRILAGLLEGKVHSDKGTADQTALHYPRLTGTMQGRQVEIAVIQKATQAGATPLNTIKHLLITMKSNCPLEMKVDSRVRSHWSMRLFWWRRINTGDKTLDDNYTIIAPERRRARDLLAHRRIRNLLIQLAPFHSLQMAGGHIRLHYLITSHQVFTARKLIEVLQRLVKLDRRCENLV